MWRVLNHNYIKLAYVGQHTIAHNCVAIKMTRRATLDQLNQQARMILQSVLLVLFGTTCLPAAVDAYKRVCMYILATIVRNDYVLYIQIQFVKEILPYHELMTPKWLHQYAYITGNYTLYPQYLELDPTTVLKQPKLQQAVDVKLVPHGILSSTDSVSCYNDQVQQEHTLVY